MKKIKVSEKAKTLLRKTIDEKWKLIVAKKGEDKGRINCSLCVEFINALCYGCPIYIKTERRSCDGTPYKEWNKHQIKKHTQGFPRKIQCQTCKKLAEEELRFLENLYKEVTTT